MAEIADAAGVNRATFYDHYIDKFALLDETVVARFHELMTSRGVAFDGTCECALSSTILAVCEYLASLPQPTSGAAAQTQSFFEASIISVVRKTLLAGMDLHAPADVSSELIATAAAWSIYGAAKEWVADKDRGPVAAAVSAIVRVVTQLLANARWLHEAPSAVGERLTQKADAIAADREVGIPRLR